MVCIAGGGWQCSGGDDAGDLARDLDERLTDALDFTRGEVLDGPAPAGEAGSDAPQVSDLTAPASLALNDAFILDIATTFAGSDPVDGMIVRVGEADRYIRVPLKSAADPGFQVQGSLGDDARIAGKSFTIHIALQTAGGITGLYTTWSLSIDGNDITAEAILRGCENVFLYCSEYPAFFQNGVTEPAICQSTTVCVGQFYADDPGCAALFANGVTCMTSLVSADTCADCESAMMQISQSGCAEPSICYPQAQ